MQSSFYLSSFLFADSILHVNIKGNCPGEIFTGLELSRVSSRRWGIFHGRVFHGINSPEGIFCESTFLLGGGGYL